MVFLYIFISYFLIFNFNCFGSCTLQKLHKAEFEILRVDGVLEITFSDEDHQFINVNISCKFTCNENRVHKFIFKSLYYETHRKRWKTEISLKFCNIGFYIYKIIANYKMQYSKYRTKGMGNITENDMAPQKDAFFRSKKKYNPINKEGEIMINDKDKLIFEDNFNVFNWSKWDLDIRIPSDTHDNDFASFQNFPQNIYIRDGILFILPKLLTEMQGFNENRIRRGTLDLGTNCTGKHFDCRRVAHSFNILPPIVSSRITTKNHFSFKYGKIQIKAKLPKGDWLFPQLFLEPLNNYYGDYDYESGQIRLAFIRGNEKLNSKQEGKIEKIGGLKLFGGVVLVGGEQYREKWMKSFLKSNIKHFGDDYHIYEVIWKENLIKFKVDNQEYFTLYDRFKNEAINLNIESAKYWNNSENNMAPFDQKFYLSFGVSAGGLSDFPDSCIDKPWKNYDPKNELKFWQAKDDWYPTWRGEDTALKIDYVRVWSL